MTIRLSEAHLAGPIYVPVSQSSSPHRRRSSSVLRGESPLYIADTRSSRSVLAAVSSSSAPPCPLSSPEGIVHAPLERTDKDSAIAMLSACLQSHPRSISSTSWAHPLQVAAGMLTATACLVVAVMTMSLLPCLAVMKMMGSGVATTTPSTSNSDAQMPRRDREPSTIDARHMMHTESPGHAREMNDAIALGARRAHVARVDPWNVSIRPRDDQKRRLERRLSPLLRTTTHRTINLLISLSPHGQMVPTCVRHAMENNPSRRPFIIR